jgi:hypothetical protein
MPEKKLIGTDANQVPTNGMLGTMAFQDFSAVNITGGKIASATLNGVLPESLIPTITFAGKVSDTALSSNVFLKTSEQTLSYRLTLAAPTVSYSSVILPHGVAPTGAIDGGMWTTTSGLFVRINGVTEQLAELGANTFTGKQSLPAATVSAASLNLAHGTAPTGAINGDVWTTTSGLFARINGNTEQLAELGANVFTGKQSFPTSTTSNASINIGQGTVLTVPSSPNNGDVWVNDKGAFMQVNGITHRVNNQLKSVRTFGISGDTSATDTDEVIFLNKTGNPAQATTITLMASPEDGKTITVIQLQSGTVTFNGNGKTVNGSATLQVISAQYGRATVIFNGNNWNVLHT